MGMQKKTTLAKGAFILGAAGLLCSLIGSLYRILLADAVGTSGMAYYQVAYPIYGLLTVVATAGIPAAISKRVSEYVAQDDYRSAHHFFRNSFRILTLVGIAATAIMALGSGLLAHIQGVPAGRLPILTIAPSFLLSALLSAYRGYFQGLQQMEPTAWSQLVEEVAKFAIGYLLARLWLGKGSVWAAVGALLGIPLSELLALVFLKYKYDQALPDLRKQIRQSAHTHQPLASGSEVAHDLWKQALPITLGAVVLPLVTLVDNVMVVNVLKSIGFSQQMAEIRFGILTGFVSPVVYVPVALSQALQVSLVPAIAASASLQRPHEVEQNASIALKLAMVVGLPCAVGLFLLGTPLLQCIFPSLIQDVDGMAAASGLMMVLSIGVLFLILAQTATGILQGIGFPQLPVRHLLFGTAVKVLVSWFLLRIPGMNVVGAGLGTLACFLVAAVMNLHSVHRIVQLPIRAKDWLIRPLWMTALMGTIAYGVYRAMCTFAPLWLAVAAGILLGAACYLLIGLRFGAINSEDCRFLPGGHKLDYAMRSIGWWR